MPYISDQEYQELQTLRAGKPQMQQPAQRPALPAQAATPMPAPAQATPLVTPAPAPAAVRYDAAMEQMPATAPRPAAVSPETEEQRRQRRMVGGV